MGPIWLSHLPGTGLVNHMKLVRPLHISFPLAKRLKTAAPQKGSCKGHVWNTYNSSVWRTDETGVSCVTATPALRLPYRLRSLRNVLQCCSLAEQTQVNVVPGFTGCSLCGWGCPGVCGSAASRVREWSWDPAVKSR